MLSLTVGTVTLPALGHCQAPSCAGKQGLMDNYSFLLTFMGLLCGTSFFPRAAVSFPHFRKALYTLVYCQQLIASLETADYVFHPVMKIGLLSSSGCLFCLSKIKYLIFWETCYGEITACTSFSNDLKRVWEDCKTFCTHWLVLLINGAE